MSLQRVAFDYKPLPVHVPFHQSTERERAIIGGYGSGKSYGGCAEVIALGLEQPGSEILVTRKTVPALRDTTEAIFQALLPPELLKASDVRRAGGHLESVIFPNGTKYYFRGMDDWRKLRSMNLAFIFYDEADEFTEEDFIGMNSRMRQTKARGRGTESINRRGVILACNPQGHNWIWKRFVSPDKAPNTDWFKSSSLDNPYLPLDYIESLLAMPDPWVRRYVLCDFDEFGGAIYPDWSWDTHVIEPYLATPQGGYFVMGFDPGTAAKNAAVWCVYDPTIHCIVAVAEYAETGLAAQVHAAHWRRIEARHRMKVRWRIADPIVTTRDRGSNMALSDQYRRLGFYFQQGPRRIDDRLPALGQLITSGRFKVTKDCPQLYEQLLNYRWSDLTPSQRERGTEAKPLKKDVDLVDAAQYVASRYIAAPQAIAPGANISDREAFSREVQRTVRQQLITKRTATPSHDLGSFQV